MKESEGGEGRAWVELLQVSNLAEAEVVQALLESAGIEVRLDYDATSRVILGPGSVNPWSKVTVRVAESERNVARRLLDRAVEESGEEDCECDDPGE